MNALQCSWALAALTGSALGQDRLLSVDGPRQNEFFAGDVCVVGDTDQDGVPDLAVGAANYFQGGPGRGSVHVFSGLDGTTLAFLFGPTPETQFGSAVDGGRDLDGDGIGDLVVGAPHTNNGAAGDAGAVRVFSGNGASLLHEVVSTTSLSLLGSEVALVGDLDADGVADYLVATSFARGVEVHSGADGALIQGVRRPDDQVHGFGHSMAALDDVDGDGVEDFLVGAPGASSGSGAVGSALVYSGATRELLLRVDGRSAGDKLGWSVARAGDVNGDGVCDFVVGAHQEHNSSGYARVFSGHDGELLYHFQGDELNDCFGFRVAGGGDIDGDGVPDLAVGAPRGKLDVHDSCFCNGYVRLFSGANGREVNTLDREPFEAAFGHSLDLAGDFNGDGRDDLVVGVPAARFGPGGFAYGRVVVFDSGSVGFNPYCTASANSFDAEGAILTARGSGSIVKNELELSVEGAPPGRPGIFFYGPLRFELPFGDGLRCVGGQIHRLFPVQTADDEGQLERDLDLTQPPLGSGPGQIGAGSAWNFQFWFRDPGGGSAGFNLSTAVGIQFVP